MVVKNTALYNFYAASVVSKASLHKAELSPLNFLRFGLRKQSAQKYVTLYLPAYTASQLLRTDVLVLHEMLIQIRQHFQAAVNEVYQIHHMFNAILAANPIGIQRPAGLLFIIVGLNGPTHLVQL